jgi:tetratricopeptide (TPR) repeat protein
LQGASVGVQPLRPIDVLGRFLRALGMEPAAIPTDLEEASAALRSWVADRHLLVVLDNARDAAQVRPLLPASPGCHVLVTSRQMLVGLAGARHLRLDVLPEQEAVDLLGSLAGRQRVAAEPEPAAKVARCCGYLPLALRISGARLAMHPHHHLSWLAGRLADERRCLDELAVGDLEVRASLALSWRALEPDQQRLLRLLGLLQAHDWAGWVVAALLEVQVDDAERPLDRLLEAHLVEVAGVDGCGQVRYRLHDLVRLYAREQLEACDSAAEEAAALERALGAWLALVEQAVPRLGGDWFGFVPGAGPARRWQVGTVIAEELLGDALAWMEAERSALLAAVLQASAAGLDGLAWQLAVGVSLFYEMRGYSTDWRRSHEVALAATRRAGSLQGQGFLLTRLGELHLFQGGPLDEAMEQFRRASALFEQCGDRYGHAVAVYGTGTVHRRRGRLGLATTDLQQALVAFEALGDHQGVAYTLHGLAGVQRQQGRLVEAVACLERAMAVSRSTGNRRGQAQALLGLARLHRELGHADQALSCSDRALAAFQQLGERFGEAHVRHNLAELYLDQERFQEADDELGECLVTFREMRDAHGQALALHSMGELRRRRSQLREAADCLRRSLDIWRELEEPAWQARTLDSLGEVHVIEGDCDGASAAWREALALFEQLDSPRAENLRSRLSELASR